MMNIGLRSRVTPLGWLCHMNIRKVSLSIFFILFYLYCPFIYLHCPFYTLGITTNAPTVALCGYATAEREQLVWALWSVCFDRCVGFLASAIGFVVTSVKRNCERKRKDKKKERDAFLYYVISSLTAPRRGSLEILYCLMRSTQKLIIGYSFIQCQADWI